MIPTVFKTSEKVKDMLLLLLDSRANIEERAGSNGTDLIISFNRIDVLIHFIDDAMQCVSFKHKGREKLFGRFMAEAVEFKVINENTFKMQTVLKGGGISIIMPKKPDAQIKKDIRAITNAVQRIRER